MAQKVLPRLHPSKSTASVVVEDSEELTKWLTEESKDYKLDKYKIISPLGQSPKDTIKLRTQGVEHS